LAISSTSALESRKSAAGIMPSTCLGRKVRNSNVASGGSCDREAFDASNGLDTNQFAVFRYESEAAVFNLTDGCDLRAFFEALELVPVLNREAQIDSPAVVQEERKMNGIMLK
jgi:hypothetical protein